MTDDFPIESRFVLDAKIGRGGSGDVHRATDRETGRIVAVKRLLAIHDDPSLLDRFRREARLLAQINDERIVQYVAHGVDAQGRACLVVEWLDGEDLSRRQRKHRPNIAESLHIAEQVALGLHALHQAGIVHRDIKPANIFLLPREGGSFRVKLIDLGIARAAGEATLTTVGSMLGTPYYMSPEQARGEDRVSARADQFSLGSVLFELLAGKRAFAGDDVFAVLAKIVLADPPRILDVVPGTPSVVEALLRRAMAKDPDDRFASALEMAQAIAQIDPWDISDAAPTSVPFGDDPTTRIAAMASAAERRVVTAIFAGFAHSTTEADIRELGVLAAEHGGVVHPTLGRRRIVVFGGARSTGDEVMRAARAALSFVEHVPGVRIAIATGKAITNVAGLSGDLIERGAAEIERDAARAGAPPIRIDEPTAEMLADHFIVEGTPGSQILVGARPSAAPPRTLLGRLTPYVGRDRELALLEATFDECVNEPVARAVLVTAAAGLGKSRLRHEFLNRISKRGDAPAVIHGRGAPLSEASAFGLLGPALRRFAGILDGEPAHEQRRKLASRLGSHAADDVLERLADLAQVPGIDTTRHRAERARVDAMVSGDRMRSAWLEWLEAQTDAGPLVLILEDLQWGDPVSVSFVDAALRALEQRPLFVIALARPEIHERFPALWSARSLQEVRLGPLTPKASERLVRAVLGADASSVVVERVVSRAEGNAFYVEELIRAVATGSGDALPDTVLGMVQARLDSLGPGAKKVLRAASLFGHVFWRSAVAKLAGEHPGALERLATSELITRRAQAAFPNEEEFVFRNALVREAAYSMIPDADRRAGHRQVATWLEQAGATDPMLLATHYELGGDPERAAGYYLRAAIAALAGNDFKNAVAHAAHSNALGNAASGGTDATPRRGRARLIEAEARRWQGDLQTAESASSEAIALLPRGSPAWFHAQRENIAANGRLGLFERALDRAREVLAERAGEGAASARIAALVPAAGHLFYAGRADEAIALVREIEAIARAAGDVDPNAAARIHQLRALHADRAGDLEAALSHHLAALGAFEAGKDVRGACQTLSNVGFIQAALGDFASAEDALRRALSAAERMGLGPAAALSLHNLGGVLAALGKLAEARDVEKRAVAAFEASADPRLEGASRVYLSRILLAAGDIAGAEEEARRVIENPLAPTPLRAGAQAAWALALLAKGRPDKALAAAEAAAQTLAELGSIEDFDVLIGIAQAEALDAVGDFEGAKTAVARTRRSVLERADRLREPARTRFLEAVPDNARCLGLAAAWAVP
ncbi:MAG: protein kinase [Polyangiaceae bacterium]|nr:protein kinase [Polyangiaceae bacterium]